VIVDPLTYEDLANRGNVLIRSDVELLVRSFYRYAAMDELLHADRFLGVASRSPTTH
jgi:hypothetical protein